MKPFTMHAYVHNVTTGSWHVEDMLTREVIAGPATTRDELEVLYRASQQAAPPELPPAGTTEPRHL